PVPVGVALSRAVILTPELPVLLMSGAPPSKDHAPLGRWRQRNYGVLLPRVLSLAVPLLLGAVALFVMVGAIAVPMLDKPTLVPSFREDELLIQIDGAPGTSLPEMTRISNAMREELRTIPGVSNVGGHVGRAILSDVTSGVN